MTNQSLATLDLSSFGNKTEKDAADRGVVLVPAPARDLSGVEAYMALDHLPKGVRRESVEADAQKLANHPDLTQVSFLEVMRQYGGDQTPAIDEMLDSVKARSAGDAGKRVVDFVNRADRTTKSLPKPSPKFLEKFHQGLATAREILDVARWLSAQIKRGMDGYKSMLDLCDAEAIYHMQQSNLSVEATARDLVIQQQEFEREGRLTHVVALMEALQVAITNRLANESMPDTDVTRLQNVNILVVARIKNLKPMIKKANMAAKRFGLQSNANALTALSQYDFATAGIDGFKADLAGQLDAITNMAANLAYFEANRFTEEQAKATVRAFDEQMQSMAQLLQTSLTSIETIELVTASLKKAGPVLAQALEDAHKQSTEAARVITQSNNEIAASERSLSAEMQRILGSAAS